MNERFSPRKRLRGVFHALRLRGPLAGDPMARMFHAFLLSLALWLGVWSAILGPLYPNPPARLGAGAMQLVSPLGSLVLLRLGFLRRASLFYLTGSWIFATYVVAFNDGLRGPFLAHYVALPILASWLIGFRGALWCIVACASSTLAFAIIDLVGIDLPRPYATTFGIWAVYLQVVLTAALPVAQILRKSRAENIERQRREQELRESEERFRRMFEEGPLGVALVGKNYHFVKVNSALCRMVGYSEAELLQKSFADITHPDDVHADVELAERLFRCEIPSFKLRKRYVKKNGEIIWIDLTASVIRDKEGEPVRLAMIEDVTEVKRTQEEALARQKLESLGVLAGGIAHDFNNLLGGILASTELALTECAEGSAVEEELQRIKTSSVRGSEIVRELMIYGGGESPTLELVDMSALVNEMLQLLKVSISKHAILKIELGQILPPIRANPAQIRQVVMNLLTNASEAIGDRSGEIRVTSGKVKIGSGSPARNGRDLAEGDYLRLEISDTGGGMTPEVQARIFDPFFSTKRAGRGLGLAAVQGIIRSHGGTINVESAPGQGSRFEILLPCLDQAAREPRDITVTPSAKEPGRIAGTLLVVEDEETLRLAVSKMLRSVGFSVIEAGDGTTGVNFFRANERKIDVVLLDMTLPGMSGREVLAELRRIQPGVKVILTTAFSQASALSSIDEQHLWGYVRKPYQLSELTSLLRKACLDEPKITGHAAG